MRIVHVFRAPVGGLFRHVRDLARGQTEQGHKVGIVCDSITGGSHADALLKELAPFASLGIDRYPISRLPGLGDFAGARAVMASAKRMKPDVLHGHGAKGGAYARFAGSMLGVRSFYTPHGGSLHQDPSTIPGKIIFASERLLNRLGTGVCFVCEFEKSQYRKLIGLKGKPSVVVFNGLWPEEFQQPNQVEGATDFLFVGEMRDLKGVDILLNAMAALPNATLTAVGDGPQLESYKALARQLGIAGRVNFPGRLTMAEASRLGRIMVLPSRFESFPYVVLETAAAGLPLITSAVGGIVEVVPRDALCIPLDVPTLAAKMRELLENPALNAKSAKSYAAHIRQSCAAGDMSRKINDFYRSAQPVKV